MKLAILLLAASVAGSDCPQKTKPKPVPHKPLVAPKCNNGSHHYTWNGIDFDIFICKNDAYVFDAEATRKEQEAVYYAEERRRDLWRALRTRVLTDEEMDRAIGYGRNINMSLGDWSNTQEKDSERIAAFQMQIIMRQLEMLKRQSNGFLF